MFTFWQHVEELRHSLIRIGVTVLVGTLVAFFFHKPLVRFLLVPLEKSTSSVATTTLERKRITASNETQITLPKGSTPTFPLNPGVTSLGEGTFLLAAGSHLDVEAEQKPYLILSPIEGFTTSLKISFWAGILLTSPFWLYFLLQFLLPALHASERALILPILGVLYLLLAAALGFALKATLPLVGPFFATFNSGIGQNAWSLSHATSFTLSLLLAHALAFELWGLLLLLTHFRLVSPSLLTRGRKGVIVAIFCLSALLTPPDVPSQLLLALPLVALYELAIVYAKLRFIRS